MNPLTMLLIAATSPGSMSEGSARSSTVQQTGCFRALTSANSRKFITCRLVQLELPGRLPRLAITVLFAVRTKLHPMIRTQLINLQERVRFDRNRLQVVFLVPGRALENTLDALVQTFTFASVADARAPKCPYYLEATSGKRRESLRVATRLRLHQNTCG